jgi:hypothetical protein
VAQHYQWLQEVGRPLRHCHMMDEVRYTAWPMASTLSICQGFVTLPFG